MALNPHRRGAPDAQAQFEDLSNEAKANLAFECHKALIKARAANPVLSENPYFDQVLLESYERFMQAFGMVR